MKSRVSVTSPDSSSPTVQSGAAYDKLRTMLAWLLVFSLVNQTPAAVPPGITIAGRVVSGTPAAPVAGATVRIGTASVVTGPDGRFLILLALPESRPATVSVTASAPGFVDAAVDVATAGQFIEITLRAAPEMRERVVVSESAEAAAVAPPTVT